MFAFSVKHEREPATATKKAHKDDETYYSVIISRIIVMLIIIE